MGLSDSILRNHALSGKVLFCCLIASGAAAATFGGYTLLELTVAVVADREKISFSKLDFAGLPIGLSLIAFALVIILPAGGSGKRTRKQCQTEQKVDLQRVFMRAGASLLIVALALPAIATFLLNQQLASKGYVACAASNSLRGKSIDWVRQPYSGECASNKK